MVANYLKPSDANITCGIGVVRAFYDGQRDQLPSLLVGALLKQLIDQSGDVTRAVTELCDEIRRNRIEPTVQNCISAFKAQVGKFARVFVIIDALDESPGYQGGGESIGEESQKAEEMRQALRAIAAIETVNLMVTARTHIDADAVLGGTLSKETLTVKISAKLTDLQAYVQDRVDRASKLKRIFTELKLDEILTWHKRIAKAVTTIACGM